MQRNFFPEVERLKSRSQIDQLFKIGKSKRYGHIRVVWHEVNDNEAAYTPFKVAFSVPKRIFKKAVDRNRLKRQMREAFRLHKHCLYEPLTENDKQLALMIVYISSDVKDYHIISDEISLCLKDIINKMK